MMSLRKSNERGVANHGWLKSRHTFSFAEYHDPKHMGFKSLRVINEDRIDGGTGFGRHPHRDMEIISYVVEGALQHQDTMGNKTVIRPGEVQVLSAGSGIQHSEMNERKGEETHFFQIWVMPNQHGQAPGYGQKSFEEALNSKKMVLTLSQDGRDGSLAIKQDANMYISRLKKGEDVDFKVLPKRGAWIQAVKGRLKVGENELLAGDGLAIDEAGDFKVRAQEPSEFLLFDLI